jgi:hypothetical protein
MLAAQASPNQLFIGSDASGLAYLHEDWLARSGQQRWKHFETKALTGIYEY